jgi:nucleoside-diphosphate-sugar epimerase
MKTIAITGAGGFIGGELVDYFLAAGRNVIGMQRNEIKRNSPLFSYLHYDLEKENDLSALKNADAIVHCAYKKWTPENADADEVNISSTNALADFCRRENKQFVFLSSFSAHENATSHYGKHKFLLENKLKDEFIVIKPGLVLGKRGMLASLCKIISERKFVPVIGSGRQPLQWIKVEDLCYAVDSALEKNLKGLLFVASEKSISFLALNELIAQELKRSPWFIFVNPLIARALLKMVGDKTGFSKENLEGLLQLREFDISESLRKLGLQIPAEFPAEIIRVGTGF